MSELFNLDEYLIEKGYKRETIKDHYGQVAFINYQKEVAKDYHNCITILSNYGTRLISACSPDGNLFLNRGELPKNKDEADQIIRKAEKF